jgi:POT family proton-dependent oligopeptide transporter
MGTMPKTPYLTAPLATTKFPPGVPYIIGNEAAERFSFYGMRAILVTYMTKFLFDVQGNPAPLTEEKATEYFHMFVAAAYFFPIFGAPLADLWLGKYRTIISLSLVYCLGHLVLAANTHDVLNWLLAGLALIAIGAGGIKPCVSAHVGDQFGKSNAHLLEKVYGWFYLSINFGSFISTILTPWLLETFPGWLAAQCGITAPEDLARWARIGPHVAFGVPGALMLIATWVFWLGRNRFAHIPPRSPVGAFAALRGEAGYALLKLVPVYLFVGVFWSLYDQSGSKWVKQAEKMDRVWLGYEWLPAQIQAINPLLILILVPIFSYFGYPAINKVFPLTPLRKISIGLFLTAAAYAVLSMAQQRIDAGQTPNIVWQLIAYVVITAAEVMVSVTGLEFSYTQSPREVKSFVMSMWLFTVSLGNVFTALVNRFIQLPNGKVSLQGAAYYWFFTKLMFGAAVLFVVVASLYRGKTYIQEEQPAES